MTDPAASTAVTVKKVKPIDEIRSNLMAMQSQFTMALPSHIPAEKFQRVAVTAISTQPDLLAADRNSLYAACMKSAQDGLLPDGREAALVVYSVKVKRKNDAGADVESWIKAVQYMPMIAGIYKKIRNSGEIKALTSAIIFKADEFAHYTDTDGEHFIHRADYFAADRGARLGAFAHAITKDGGAYLEVMTHAQIEAVRAKSKAANGPAWKDNWDEMARKTVMRRLSKRLPMSTDLESTMRADDDFYDGGDTIDNATGEVVQPSAAAAAEPTRRGRPRGSRTAPPGLQGVADGAPANAGQAKAGAEKAGGDDGMEIPGFMKREAPKAAEQKPPVILEHEPQPQQAEGEDAQGEGDDETASPI